MSYKPVQMSQLLYTAYIQTMMDNGDRPWLH